MTARLPMLALLLGLLPTTAQEQQAELKSVAPPSAEQDTSGSVSFGYRWIAAKGGSEEVYRSVVNLGEGPKLFSADAIVRRPGGRWYDRLDLHATSWGGDPYNTARLDAARAGAYAFHLDYANIRYFNSLPSFANPLLNQGVLFSQRSLDTRRRLINGELELRPDARLSPYLAFYHGSGSGRGITTFVADGNEFPVGTRLRDETDSYRGGVRLNVARLNVTLEQGGTTFKDDQQVSFAGGVNPGNRRVPLLDQDLSLRELGQAYGARGNGIFTRGAFEARPWSRLSFAGQFLYSKPSIDVTYFQQNTGSFVLLEAFQVFTGELDRSLSEASRPRSSANWTTEIRPAPRVRVVQSWFTDRFHVAGTSLLARSVLRPSREPLETSSTLSNRLVLNLHRHQTDALVEAASFLTLRGGHRYEWGDAASLANVTLAPGTEVAALRRHVALAGAGLRLGSSLDFSLDLEAAAGDRTFFRTDLADYERARMRGRYRWNRFLTLTGTFAILNNRNHAHGIDLDYQGRQSSLAVLLTPGEGRRWSLALDYTRATIRSSLPYLEPQDRVRLISTYREDGHYGGAMATLHLWPRARIDLGASLALTAGSRPTRYHQPQARFLTPLRGQLAWQAEWRWFGFTERGYAFENFHTHLLATGLQFGF